MLPTIWPSMKFPILPTPSRTAAGTASVSVVLRNDLPWSMQNSKTPISPPSSSP